VNVLNVEVIERELKRYAARTFHADASRWVSTVARNYILSRLPEKDVIANFKEVTLNRTSELGFITFTKAELPEWAFKAIKSGDKLMWFDPIQVRRRELWCVLDVIVIWLNNWKADDTRLRRIDRIGFPVATDAAVLWYKDVSANIWNYVTDKPVVVKEYDRVKLVTSLQFEREGKLMNHCVGNGGYYARWRTSSANEYYSLRDRHNKPHATMEVHFDGGHPLIRKGSVMQCKGNSNQKPSREYQSYIKKFVTDMKWIVAGDATLIDQ